MRALITAAAIGLTSSAASADFYTGLDLHNTLSGPAYQQATAVEYIKGNMDALGGFNYCPPPGAKGPQAGLMLRNFLRDHPEHLDLPAAPIIVHVLSAAWPCKKKGT